MRNYSAFNTRAEGAKQDWTICTHKSRIVTFRNPEKNSEWDNKEILLTKEFISHFNQYGINYQSSKLKEMIVSRDEKGFFETLLKLFKLSLQMRNSISNSEEDFLISPVANNDGEFYNSKTEQERGKDGNGDWLSKLPIDADANGGIQYCP